jgi:poly(A) polymerase
VKDVDIATPLPPDDVLRRLKAAGLGAVATGLAHGTVTALVNRRPYEITTLRRDLETDGRHARVEFTDDWEADAQRRDLTINALFCDTKGAVWDYVGGAADLAAGRVRFVGEARRRIEEDYLRLLRFFRFQAHYGRVPPDPETLAVARELAPRLDGLSGERIRSELLRLLSAPDPVPVLEVMVEGGLLQAVLPQVSGTAVLVSLLGLDLPEAADPVLRLGALLAPGAEEARRVAERLRLSNAETAELEMLGEPEAVLGEAAAVLTRGSGDAVVRHALAIALYRAGPARFRVALAIALARLVAADPASRARAETGLRVALEAAGAWREQRFPLAGADVLALGYPSGPDVGSLLRAVEEWWIDEDFTPDRAACLARLRTLANSISPVPPKAPGT